MAQASELLWSTSKIRVTSLPLTFAKIHHKLLKRFVIGKVPNATLTLWRISLRM